MNNVTLTISGRQYTVACAPGEEPHIRVLGEMIQAKISTMGEFPGQSEQRNLLFAALLLADELVEMKAQSGSAAHPQPDEPAVQRLGGIALRLENLAVQLEGSPATS